MEKEKVTAGNFNDLRQRVQRLLSETKAGESVLSAADTRRLLYELNTYQIELEIQNKDLRQVQIELGQSRRRYTELYEFAPVGYLTVSEKGLIVEANLYAANMLGLPRDHLLKRSLSAFILDEDQDIFYHHRTQLLASQSPQSCELRMIKKGSPVCHIHMQSTIRSEVDGDASQFWVVITDISERKVAQLERIRFESQLRQAHKMEAIGTMTGGLAHDFNTILAIIIGYAELAIIEIPDFSSATLHIEKVLEASDRAKLLIRQILSFSGILGFGVEQDHVRTTLSSIVDEAMKLQRSVIPSTIEISSDIVDDNGQISGDTTQINQVLMNLCSNATHAMEEHGGTLAVGLHQIEFSSHDLKKNPDMHAGTYTRLSVGDTGPGMTPEIMDKIFDPYFTTKNVGKSSGMGLSIVRGIVKSHGGFINVESSPGNGSTFNVFFPRIGEENIPEYNERTEDIPTGTERILFVDDEEMLADVGKSTLESIGYSVTALTSSSQALELFQRESSQFDLVITDQTMPILPGSELAKKLFQIRSDIPIIICTGYSRMINEEKARKIGVRGYAMKPLDRKVIAQLIRKVLDGDGFAS